MKRNLVLCVALATSTACGVASLASNVLPPTAGVLVADEKKHDHKHEEEHKGEKKDLGKKKIGDYQVQVTQIGHVKPGEEAVFVVVLSGATAKPKAVRGWVGVESAEKSIRSAAEDEGKEYHLHHKVSKPIPQKEKEKSKLWVEVETGSGKKKASFDYKPE